MSDNIAVQTISSAEKLDQPVLYSPHENSGIDIHVSNQFPSFVSEDHPRFVDFMETYYEWMQLQHGVLKNSQNLKNEQNIETASEAFKEQFFKEFLVNIPRNVLVNKATLLKHIKQFYKAKGTKKSYDFLFRLLFNTNLDLYYPKIDILKTSDGKWIKNKTIKIIRFSGDPKTLQGKKIRGTINNSTAFVEKLLKSSHGPYEGYELFFNISSIAGKFFPNEIIVSEDNSFSATICPIPTEYKIVSSGKDYKVDQIFDIARLGMPGSGARIRITEVDAEGAILAIQIERYGLGYSTDSPPTEFALGTNNNINNIAKINFNLGAVTDYPGYYLNDDGQPSAAKYLHDGYYYQQFSYVTYSDQSKNYYEDIMKRLVHPLGFKNFGGVRIQQHISAKTKSAQDSMPVKIVYFGSKPQIRPAPSTKIVGKTDVIIKHDINKDAASLPLGPSYLSLNREKFNHKPFFKYDANNELNSATNPNYFGTLLHPKSITPVSAFVAAGFTHPKQVDVLATQKTNVVPDAVVKHDIPET